MEDYRLNTLQKMLLTLGFMQLNLADGPSWLVCILVYLFIFGCVGLRCVGFSLVVVSEATL